LVIIHVSKVIKAKVCRNRRRSKNKKTSIAVCKKNKLQSNKFFTKQHLKTSKKVAGKNKK
jgi:hypothetical protein